ncbi:hypothetical protein E0K89_011750 [Aquicoccus sp. SCR17]|nr:hypothetical protein [Carideicomes alvinocaridis]
MARAPRHLWLVGGAALIWNAMGIVDFVLVQTGNTQDLARLGPVQAEWFLSAPLWESAIWGIATGFSLVGSALMLLRQRPALPFLGIGFAAFLLLSVQEFLLAPTPLDARAGPAAQTLWAAILLVALLTWLYAWAMVRARVLR